MPTKTITAASDALSQLAETRRELDAFIYRASHDLKGPLARMEGLTQLMAAGDTGPEVKFSIKLIETLTHEMQQVINDLIHIQGMFKAEPILSQVDPHYTVAEILSSLQKKGMMLPAKWKADIGLPFPWKTDRTLIRIILEQLLKNAFQFTAGQNETEVALHISQEGAFTVIKVQDNGQGIPPEQLDRVFELFYKSSEESNGSGLGLYLVKKAVFQLQGSVECSSEVGKFTRFRVCLPWLG